MSSKDEALSEELRAELSAADINDLPDKDFAYIEPGGEKDDGGKTVPRSLRHFPIQDAAHVQNALTRLSQSPFGDKAKAKVYAAAKKFGIEVADDTESKADDAPTEERAKCPTCKGDGTILEGNRKCPDCDGTGDAPESRADAPVTTRKRRARAVPLAMELRRFNATDLEVREAANGDDFILRGTPIVYSTAYDVYDAFGRFSELIEPGAVTDVLSRGADVRMLFDHSGLPLARTASGTMTLADTPTGLTFEARLDPRQQLANDLYLAVSRGDVSQMSIGMRVSSDSWDDALENRTIHKIEDLLDVSAVTYPASPSTSIEIAQRMAMMVPVESAARIRKMYIDTRAGAKMSGATQKMLADAFMGLHSALSDAGASLPGVSPLDPDGSNGQDGDAGNGETNADALTPEGGTESVTEPVGNEDDVQELGDAQPSGLQAEVFGDGSQGGATQGGAGYPGYADGSGLRAQGASLDAEKRAEASMSFGDQQSAVYQALLGLLGDGDGDCDLWVCDLGPDWVVFESYIGNMGLWKVGYSCDADGNVAFSGDCVQVAQVTDYVPVQAVALLPSVVQGRSVRDLRLALEARKRRRAS